MREVRSGGSYLSQNDLRVHFGLGPEKKISSLDILWPSGLRETVTGVDADFLYDLKEGAGIQNRTALSAVVK